MGLGLALAWPWPGGKAREILAGRAQKLKISKSGKINKTPAGHIRLGLGLALARPRWAGLDLGLAGIGQPISSTFRSSSLRGFYFFTYEGLFFHSLGGSLLFSLFIFSLWRGPKVKKVKAFLTSMYQ